MIIDLNTRFQIAAVLFFVVLVSSYYRFKRIPVLSSKIFNITTCVGAINLIFDIITVWTVNNLDVVEPWVNRLCHQIFIFTLDLVAGLFCLYIMVIGDAQKRPKGKRLFAACLPMVVSVVMILFGPLYYYESPTGSYSYGPMANTVYACVAIYLFLILLNTRRFSNDEAGKEKKIAVRISLASWIGAGCVQMFNHNVLMSGLAEVMMFYYVYYAFENPKETVEIETGCRNRRGFNMMALDMLERKHPFVIVNIAYSDMLKIYLQYGHEIGHRYMLAISARLKEIYGPFIFRSKGSVMSVFVEQDKFDALDYMLEQTKEALKKPVLIDDYMIQCKVHIDVLRCPEYAKTTDDIINIIEYMAGHETENNAEVIYADREILDKKERYFVIEELLAAAIREDGFDIYYQPIYHPTEGGFLSAEALIRLKDRDTIGYISPEEFIPIAERRGMISQIGMIVFEKVCSFAREQELRQHGVRYIEVNLSGVQCEEEDLADKLHGVMEKYEIPPEFIDLEITETAAIEAGKNLYRNMERLKQSGVTFAMDDFGTGYSNLAQMVEVAYEYVKLDKSLLWPAFEENNEKARILLAEVIELVQKLGMGIIAEGVETREQAQWLIEKKVGHLQGYYYSRPVCGAEYLKFIEAHMSAVNV